MSVVFPFLPHILYTATYILQYVAIIYTEIHTSIYKYMKVRTKYILKS